MMRRAACLLILVLMSGSVLAQAPVMPGSGPAMPMGVPQAADPDTVAARLTLAEGLPLPVAVSFAPDTVTVGRDAWLKLEFAPADAPADPQQLLQGAEFSAEWIALAPGAQVQLGPDGTLDLPVKIYQINPFRVEVGDLATQVVLVDFRTSGTQETAAIRDPRRWGWNLWTLLTGAALFAALVLLLWWIWTASKVATERLPDWEVPPPAWLQAAIQLRQLDQERLAESGQARLYLDRLAGICRRYLAGRFRVGAPEMTGPEILTACNARGHDTGLVRRFTQLLERIDSSRYDPVGPSPADCRLRRSEFINAVDQVRIQARYTPVAAELALAGEKAWSQLAGDETAGAPALTGAGDDLATGGA